MQNPAESSIHGKVISPCHGYLIRQDFSGGARYHLGPTISSWGAELQVESWGSIAHFTATGNNCCTYGDRIPAIWCCPGLVAFPRVV